MQHSSSADHARHDALLIAGQAAGDLSDPERVRADALVAECSECSALRRDLVALAAAVRSVPAPAEASADFRLTPEQAGRLRRGSWLRALLRPFGAVGSPARPMAAAFTSLGVVGLVVGITLSSGTAMLSGTAGTTQQERAAHAPAASAAAPAPGGPAASERAPIVAAGDGEALETSRLASGPPGYVAVDNAASQAPVPAPEATSTDLLFGANRGNATDGGAKAGQARDGGQDGAVAGSGGATTDEIDREADVSHTPPSPLIAGSLALLGIGLLLFGLRIASRRLG